MGEYGKHTITDQFRKIAYGLKVGIGVEIGRIMVNGRYDWGIADVYKTKALMKMSAGLL